MNEYSFYCIVWVFHTGHKCPSTPHACNGVLFWWNELALVELQLSLDAVLWWPSDSIQTPYGIPGFAQFALNVLVGTSILSDNAAQIGKGLCAGKGLVIKQDWCWSTHVQGPDLHFSLAYFIFAVLPVDQTYCQGGVSSLLAFLLVIKTPRLSGLLIFDH